MTSTQAFLCHSRSDRLLFLHHLHAFCNSVSVFNSDYSPCLTVSWNDQAHPFLSIASTSSTLMPKMKRLSSPASSAISTLAPSMVPMVRAPFSMNFMFPVPEASVPAVDICSDRSDAGMTADKRQEEKLTFTWLIYFCVTELLLSCHHSFTVCTTWFLMVLND